MFDIPKNQLFYGPASCGKTYRTVIEALRILGSELIKPDTSYIYTPSEYKCLVD